MGISLHSELEPIGHTHKQHLHASLAVLLASQAQKRSYDDAFKLKAVEDAERQPTELLLESLRLIMTYIHAVIILRKFFVAALIQSPPSNNRC